MRRVAMVVLALALVSSCAPWTLADDVGTGARMYFHTPTEAPAPVDSLYLLDSNVSANLTAFLLADRVDDLHELETLDLTIVHRLALDPEGNGSLRIQGGGEVGPIPDICLWGPVPERRDFTTADCTFRAWSWKLRMQHVEPLVQAWVTVANDTVELKWNATLGPVRIYEHARLVLPATVTELSEQARTDVQLVIENAGGLDALDQVIDVRYGGRNIAVVTVPLVPAGGDHTIALTLDPILGTNVLEVHVVQGPGAPYLLAALHVPVRPVALLTVDSVQVSSASVEEGLPVTITATVRNLGNLTTSNASVQFLVDGAVVANATVDGLVQGASMKVTGTWTATAPGTHAVSVRVEGGPLDARVASVKVTGQSPAGGAAAVLAVLVVALACLALRRAARR